MFFSFSLFIACIVLVAHNIVELQSDREWVQNESVDKDYPQKVILEITIAITNIHWELVVKTSFLFQENCQELPGLGANLLRISSIWRS